MTCKNCGQGIIVPVDVDEPSDSGYFSEEWECNVCGAKMFVHGREEQPPREWDRFGSAIED